MVKRRSKSRRSYSGSGNIWGNIMGVGGVIAYKNYLSGYIPLSPTAKTIGEIFAGYYLSKKGGFVGNFGKALVTIDIYMLGSAYLSGMTTTTGVNNSIFV